MELRKILLAFIILILLMLLLFAGFVLYLSINPVNEQLFFAFEFEEEVEFEYTLHVSTVFKQQTKAVEEIAKNPSKYLFSNQNEPLPTILDVSLDQTTDGWKLSITATTSQLKLSINTKSHRFALPFTQPKLYYEDIDLNHMDITIDGPIDHFVFFFQYYNSHKNCPEIVFLDGNQSQLEMAPFNHDTSYLSELEQSWNIGNPYPAYFKEGSDFINANDINLATAKAFCD